MLEVLQKIYLIYNKNNNFRLENTLIQGVAVINLDQHEGDDEDPAIPGTLHFYCQ
jgi:hypothetical protein